MTNRTTYQHMLRSAARQPSGAATDDLQGSQAGQGQTGGGFSAMADATYRQRRNVREKGAQTPDAPAESSSAADDDADAWQSLVARTYQRRHADRAQREEAAAEERFIIATDRREDAQSAGDPGARGG